MVYKTLQGHMVLPAARQSVEANIFNLAYWIKPVSFRKKEVMRIGINRYRARPDLT